MTAPPLHADPVKLLAAILWREPECLSETVRRLAAQWGDCDHQGADHPFDATAYYQPEMGSGLRRRIVSFAPLIAPERLVDVKLSAAAIEDALRGPAGRRVNLDPGYLDLHKVVLASMKFGALKIHLGRGVYADVTCRHSEGKFHPFEWTFADFKDGRYDGDLTAIRALYKAQLRSRAPGAME